MAIVVDAVYEDGVLKLGAPLPLKEHENVRVTVESNDLGRQGRTVIPCADAELIDQIALDKEIEYEQ